MNRIFLLFLCVVLVATIGCGNKQSLRGTVTFSDDGSPVPTGTVYFSTPTFEATGQIKQDGTYAVSSTGKEDGIPKGQTYTVTVVGVEDEEITQDANGNVTSRKRTPLIDPKYNRKETSGLTFTSDGASKFDIKLDRAAK